MNLSYFMMPLHGLEKDYHQQLLEDKEAIILADELGFAEAWVGEHYSSGLESITSPLMFLANLIPRTKQIKLATGVICMPQYHPATIAGQAAMFDHLCDGRFILGVGPGGLPSDFELFGTMDADRNEMFVESIDTVLKYWSTEPPYNFEGKYWKSKIENWTVPELKLGYMVKPLQQPHPPIAVSAMSPHSGSMKLAGRRGWQPVSANFIGVWSVKSTRRPQWSTGTRSTGKCGVSPAVSMLLKATRKPKTSSRGRTEHSTSTTAIFSNYLTAPR